MQCVKVNVGDVQHIEQVLNREQNTREDYILTDVILIIFFLIFPAIYD